MDAAEAEVAAQREAALTELRAKGVATLDANKVRACMLLGMRWRMPACRYGEKGRSSLGTTDARRRQGGPSTRSHTQMQHTPPHAPKNRTKSNQTNPPLPPPPKKKHTHNTGGRVQPPEAAGGGQGAGEEGGPGLAGAAAGAWAVDGMDGWSG